MIKTTFLNRYLGRYTHCDSARGLILPLSDTGAVKFLFSIIVFGLGRKKDNIFIENTVKMKLATLNFQF